MAGAQCACPRAAAHWPLRRSRTRQQNARKASTEDGMTQANDIYPVPAGFAAGARLKRDDYERLYAESLRDPQGFWGKVGERLDWMRKPTQVKDVSYALDDFHIRWFADGE